MTPAPIDAKKFSSGEISRVPCPWCGAKLDLSEVGTGALGEGWSGQGLETGCLIDCDHCSKPAKVTAIVPMTVVKLVAHQK
jgi:hypothetical protein